MNSIDDAGIETRLERQRRWLIWAAGFLYTLSLHKYVVRDAHATGSGIQGILEFGFTISAALCTFLALRGVKRRFPPSGAMLCFVIFGIFALASSWRSFSPPLSLAKGILFFAVLGMGYLAGQAGYLKRLLQSIYWTYAATLVVGILVGLALPSRFPLWETDEYTLRSRFSVFGTFPGTMGETAAYLILLAPLIFNRPHWISRGLLLVVNFLAGGKTSTVLLLVMLLVEYLLKIRQARSWRVVALAVAVTCGVGFLAYLSVAKDIAPAAVVGNRLTGVYGNDVAAEATSLDGRLGLWEGSFSAMVASPALGFGVDGARDVFLKLAFWAGSAHNGFLDLGLDGGVIALFFFVMGLFMVFRACTLAAPNVRSQLLIVFVNMFVIAWTGITFSFPSFFGFLLLVQLLFIAREFPMNAIAARREGSIQNDAASSLFAIEDGVRARVIEGGVS